MREMTREDRELYVKTVEKVAIALGVSYSYAETCIEQTLATFQREETQYGEQEKRSKGGIEREVRQGAAGVS